MTVQTYSPFVDRFKTDPDNDLTSPRKVDGSKFRIWHQFDCVHSINRATYWAGAKWPKAECGLVLL